MNRSRRNLLLAVAVAAAASTMASAQSLKAEIPFSFRAGGALMAPGSYVMRASDGESHFSLYNTDTHRSILLSPGIPSDAPAAWKAAGDPKLEFLCNNGSCTLQRIWTGTSSVAHQFAKPNGDSHSGLAVIRTVTAAIR